MTSGEGGPGSIERVLGDAVGRSRPRTPGDAADPDVPVAATAVLARNGADGIEVLLIERPDRGSFAGAWVFPGGRLDDADRRGAAGEADAARTAAVRETQEETGLVLPPDALVPLSVWDPPPGIALRIRTWFFVAAAPDAEPVLAAEEAVSAWWARPADALRRHASGDLTLYPPTWVTLHGLADHATAAALLDATRLAGVRRFETVARRAASGPVLLWHGDAEYDDGDAGSEASARHRLEIGALPWIYTRAD